MIKDGLSVKEFKIIGTDLYLDNEKLPCVEEFSLKYAKKVRGEPFAEAQYPYLEVKGSLVDESGSIVTKFGEIIKYHISERVKFVGGDSNV